jgi:hypothetical protein
VLAELTAAGAEGCAVVVTVKGAPPLEGTVRCVGRGLVRLATVRGIEVVQLSAIESVKVLRERAAAVRAVLLSAMAERRRVRVWTYRGDAAGRISTLRRRTLTLWRPGYQCSAAMASIVRVEEIEAGDTASGNIAWRPGREGGEP